MADPYETIDTNQDITADNKATPYFVSFLRDREILIGSGSPENVVEATPSTLYMDSGGSAGNILYIKKTGTGNTGWILV